MTLRQRFEDLWAWARAAYRGRPRLFQIAGVILLVLMAPRLLAEYYYLRIVLNQDVATYFGRLDRLGGASVSPLIRLLGSRRELTREFAAESLGKYRGRRVVSALMDAARDDPDATVRNSAIKSLGGIGDPRAVPLVKDLGWKVATKQLHVARTAASDEGYWNARLAEEVRGALLGMGDDGKKALLEYVRGSPDVKWGADALSSLCFGYSPFKRDPEVREEATRALSKAAWEMRSAGAACIPNTLGPAGIGLLKPLLEDASPWVRISAARGLGMLNDTSGFSVIQVIVSDTSLEKLLRSEALLALGDIHDERALPFLCGFIASEPGETLLDSAKNSASRLRPDRVSPCQGAAPSS